MSFSDAEIVKTIELNFAKMELRGDGIVTFIPNYSFNSFNTNQIEAVYETMLNLTSNRPSPIYVDWANHLSLSSEEKNLIASKLSMCLTACAIKEDNIMIRFVVHVFNHVYKPDVPIKMFKTKEDAILWLKEF
ncbi:MAG: hypothetical protein AB7O47_01005 [Flavobacteriales bacterium]